MVLITHPHHTHTHTICSEARMSPEIRLSWGPFPLKNPPVASYCPMIKVQTPGPGFPRQARGPPVFCAPQEGESPVLFSTEPGA